MENLLSKKILDIVKSNQLDKQIRYISLYEMTNINSSKLQ